MRAETPCRLSSFTEENRDLRTRCHIPARAGPKVDTWSKVDVACVKSLWLCLHGVYPQRLLWSVVPLYLPGSGSLAFNLASASGLKKYMKRKRSAKRDYFPYTP